MRIKILLVFGLLALMSIIAPNAASAQDSNVDTFDQVVAEGEQYLGDGFSVSANGWRGEQGMLDDAAADPTTCAAYALQLVPAGSGYTVGEANALADQPYGGDAHRACYDAVMTGLANTEATVMPAYQSPAYQQAMKYAAKAKHKHKGENGSNSKARGVKCTPKYCVFLVEGRTKSGKYKWKPLKVKRGKPVVVFTTTVKVHVKEGEWTPAGAAYGTGLGGCTNHMAQEFEKKTVKTFRAKMRFRYANAGKPDHKGPTPGPGGGGGSLPPAQPPIVPPSNPDPGPVTPDPNPEPDPDPPPPGGCVNEWGQPKPC